MSLFGDENKRKINLGGSSSGAPQSQAALFDQVKQRRELRLEQKRRSDAAIRIQSQWRGVLSKQGIRSDLRRTFESDVTGLSGMRCLVLLGQDNEALGRWCSAMAAANWATNEMTESWIVLARQLSVRMLKGVAANHANSLLYLQTLDKLLSHSQSSAPVLRYLLPRSYYSLLSTALLAYPKTSAQLPLLVSFTTCPVTIFSSSNPEFITAINDLFDFILTISLLPNRMPINSLMQLSSNLPLAHISLVQLARPLSVESRVHIVANLLTFVTPPRYATLKKALPAYLTLLSNIFDSLPVGALDPKSMEKSAQETQWAADVDSDDEDISVIVVSDFNKPKPPPLPQFDARTLKRLQTLPSLAHLSALKAHAQRYKELVRFFFALSGVWPSQKSIILSTVSPGWIREIYRLEIRSSALGREHGDCVYDPKYSDVWPSMLLLCDAYTQALLTMGDEEFFSEPGTKTQNALNLNDLTVWTKQLLNVAYSLFWKDAAKSDVCPGVRVPWDGVRDRATKCLVAIRTRDSRKPFLTPEHWHILTDEADLQSFVDAAVYEEELLVTGVDLPANRSRKQLADISPRLGILNNIPFVIPFEVRVRMFRSFVTADRVRTARPRFVYDPESRPVVRIRRERVAEDGFNKLEGDPEHSGIDIKSPFQIEFQDQFGNLEAGIDGGGVFKEFFTSLCKEVFDTNRGLWLPNNQQELYPSPTGFTRESISLRWYRFIGKILGKAMYEGILVDVAFASFFIAKLLGRQTVFDDLASLDDVLYKGLLFLKHYEGDVADLALNFNVNIDDFGVSKTIDLIPNGSSVAVTKENRVQYIWLMANYKLSKQIKVQSESFFEGLREVIQPRWLRMFNQQEVQILMGGVDTLIDFSDLRANTKYGGMYNADGAQIEMFWSVLETFNQEERRAFLRFATSCSRPPLLGFKELMPTFSIRDAGSDEQRLPTSSTCVNLLKLPMYRSPRVMREKLLKAIMSGAGFDLS